jgi:hypothetical protein
MMEVIALENGQFAVRKIGEAVLEDTLGVFDTQLEAEEWMLERTLRLDEAASGLGVLKPGGSQGLS